MTLNELRYIVAVAKEKHFRKAAEKCFVSQPTLSIAIKKLEEKLEVVIFERNKNDVLITPIGEQIIEIAESILQQTKLIKQISKSEEENSKVELKVGAIYTVAPYLYPKLIPEFQKLMPDTPFILEENYTDKLVDKLIKGDLDLAILSMPFENPNLEVIEIYEESFVAAIPNNHPLAKKEKINMTELENENFILLGSGHCFRDQVINYLPITNQSKYSLQKTLESTSLETIRYMVASGAGVTVLPCSSILETQSNLFTIKKIEEPVPYRKIALAVRKTFARKNVLKSFLEAINQVDLPCTKKNK